MPDATRRVAILAVQGGVSAHARVVEELGLEPVEVRASPNLDRADALVLPGGESTTQRLLVEHALLGPALDSFFASGRPVLATCAGLILAASRGWLDVGIRRNAWGRQVHSFEARADDGHLALLFIRAPRIDRVGPGVKVLATFKGEPVLVCQRNITAATFHPELGPDTSVHRSALL